MTPAIKSAPALLATAVALAALTALTALTPLTPAHAQTRADSHAAACKAAHDTRPDNRNYPRDTVPRYIKTPTGYLIVLRMGDNVFEQLESFAICENVPAASLSAIGFANVTFGFWDAGKQDFNPKTYRNVEMASIVGSLAWKNGKPSIHAHGVAGDSQFDTYGGHILSMEVGTGSLEVTVTLIPEKLERAVDPRIGANVLQLSSSH